MEQEHKKVSEFLETVFHDMRMRQNITGVVNLSSPDRVRARPYARFKKLLNLMYRALDPMHRSGFDTLFSFLPLNKANAFELMSSHCSSVWDDCIGGIDVFIHLMYTCCFTYSLLAFCESKGRQYFLLLFTGWIGTIYTDSIEPKFKAAFGWDGLDLFCSSLNLHYILDFINLCYNRQGKLFTYITIGNRYYFYGLHHDETLTKLKNYFQDFKDFVFTQFQSEINSNEIYKFGVMLAFVKIELAFDLTASIFNPPCPPRRLLYSTPFFFNTYLLDSFKYEMPASIRRVFVGQKRTSVYQDYQEQVRIYLEKLRIYQEQALDYLEQALSNEEPDLDDQEPDLDDQEQDLGDQEQDLGDQESDLDDQEPDLDDQGQFSLDQNKKTHLTVEQDFASEKQAPNTVNQIIATVEQTPANVKQAQTIVEVVVATDEQSPTVKAQTPTTVKQIIATLEQALAERKLIPPAEKFSSDHVEPRNFIEKKSNVLEQVPDIVEKASDILEQTLDIVEQTPNIVEQAPGVVEQAPGVVEQVPNNVPQTIDIVEQSPNNISKASEIVQQEVGTNIRRLEQMRFNLGQYFEVVNIAQLCASDSVNEPPCNENRKPNRRLVLVKQSPDDADRDSDTDEKAC